MKWLPSIFIGLLLAGCASVPGTNILTAKDSGREVTMAVGATLTVELTANPTTGYDWKPVAASEPVLKLVRSSYAGQRAPQGYVGVVGTDTFEFYAEKPGQQELQLNYVRPWEKDTPPVETVTYKITVK